MLFEAGGRPSTPRGGSRIQSWLVGEPWVQGAGMPAVPRPCQPARVGSAGAGPDLRDAGEAGAGFAMPGSGFADVSRAATSC